MDIRQAIKVLLALVEEEKGSALSDEQIQATILLKRYTSGWVPKEPVPEWMGKDKRAGKAPISMEAVETAYMRDKP